MFRKMPFALFGLMVAILWMGPWVPLPLKESAYALSLSIKEVIVFVLPLVIFGLLFRAAVQLAHRATWVIGAILLTVCCSNFLSTFLSHWVGRSIYRLDLSLLLPQSTSTLQSAWSLALPRLFPNTQAMLAGIILGILSAMLHPPLAHRLAARLEQVITQLLSVLAYVIPIFIVGFVIKLEHEGTLRTIFKNYTLIFGIVAMTQFTYLTIAYWAVNRFNIQAAWNCIQNLLPAAITGFSTMSSIAAMPLTLIGAEKNARNKDLARCVIPATVNIHLIGDCFAIPLFAYAVLKNYGLPEPTLVAYLLFAGYFVLAKFSVAAIPGGGILVMLPILETYLGFTSDMLSLITALYILFDPVITCANILGNGLFAKFIDSLLASDRQK